jgi:plastocyanin
MGGRGVAAGVAVLVGALASAGGAAAATKTVVAGPPVAKAPKGVPRDADVNLFYRKTVTIHAGDRVRWRINGFHTVTFPAKGDKPPGLALPDRARPVAGVNDAAGKPFWFNGQPSVLFNPAVAFPAGGRSYTGSQLTGSGAPLGAGAPKPFTLRFPKTGTYRYYCAIHLGDPSMQGTVRVVPRSRRIPSAAADRRAAAKEFAASLRQVKRDDKVTVSGDVVRAGVDSPRSTLLRFVPAQKTVKVGQSLTFQMSPRTNEVHTVTFGSEADLKPLVDGFIAPIPGTQSLQLNPQAAYPSDPPPTLPPLTPALHGNGFLNTGILDRVAASPNPAEMRVTFGQAGTYRYICIIHPQMVGQITVTP